MSENSERGRFQVAGHHELKGRGAFVIGHVIEGVIRVGMKTDTGLEPAVLTVSGVKFLDNLRERKYWNALIFAERPPLEFVKRAFPLGSVIETRAAAPDAS